LGAIEGGVTEREDATVRTEQPVALAVGGGSDADDGLIEMLSCHAAIVGGPTVGVDQSS
jgi:hypothetical protein